jgi:hypothetical protein
MKFLRFFAFVLAAPVLAHTPPTAQEATLDAVLARAGAYVVEFQRQLSGIVAEEQYVQDVRYPAGVGTRNGLPRHRELKSDLLLVKPAGGDRWLQFRDVYEVDRRAVRDRNERLMQLFMSPSASSAKQTDRIIDESSRYNIGNLQRTVNVPVLALVVLDPGRQSRFAFKRSQHLESLLGRGPAAGADIWVVEYHEVQKPTMIRTDHDRNLPARGRFWIEAGTGRVTSSELIVEDPTIGGSIAVDYQPEPAVGGLLVPVRMREHYDIHSDGSRVEGDAAYSHFRQFQVKVDEKLAPIVKQ